nr:hypothetical protein [Lachnospiraceae bacterium]
NRASTIRAIIPEINKETDKSRMKLKIKGKAVSFKRMKLGDGYLVLHLYPEQIDTTSLKIKYDDEKIYKCRLKVK